VMDHRVLDHYDGDITRVNVHPRMRDKVLAKYGVGDERSREEQGA
jgi:alkane 1-monooxygenase